MKWFMLEERISVGWRFLRGVKAKGIRSALDQVEKLVDDPTIHRLKLSTKKEVEEFENSMRKK